MHACVHFRYAFEILNRIVAHMRYKQAQKALDVFFADFKMGLRLLFQHTEKMGAGPDTLLFFV